MRTNISKLIVVGIVVLAAATGAFYLWQKSQAPQSGVQIFSGPEAKDKILAPLKNNEQEQNRVELHRLLDYTKIDFQGKTILTLAEWQAWAVLHWKEVMPTPVIIAGYEVTANTFCCLSPPVYIPEKNKIFFAVTTLEIALSSISRIGWVDITTRQIEMFGKSTGEILDLQYNPVKKIVIITSGSPKGDIFIEHFDVEQKELRLIKVDEATY